MGIGPQNFTQSSERAKSSPLTDDHFSRESHFVAAKTGIDVGPEVRLCSNGVLHDDSSCRPNGTGGVPWVKNENFDIYPVTGADGRSET